MRLGSLVFVLAAVLLLQIAVAPSRVQAQATTQAPSGVVGTPTVEDTGSTLLTMGDLILRNPMQSTSIFFMIILFSTGLEYLFELLDNQRNAYLRNIILSTKEELAAVAFSQMVLIFLSLVVNFSAIARAVVLLATLMIVFMCFNFAVYVVIVNVLQSRRSLEWATFEWARIDLDALHSKQEALFKNARSVFLRRSKVGARVRQCLSEGREGATSIMPVLFGSYLGHVERTYLKESFDFTWVTWTALIAIVIADGLRSITVNSMGGTAEEVARTQILTFVFVVGWGLLAGLVLITYLQQKRISGFIMQWNLTGSFADVTATASATSRRRDAAGDGPAAQQQAGAAAAKSDDQLSTELRDGFFFGSVGGALSVLQVLMLGLLWFSCVFVVGMVQLSWVSFGWVALVVYAAAAVPFFAAVTLIMPAALTDIFIAASISVDFDDDIVQQSVNGLFDLRQIEAESDDEFAANDGDDAARGGGADARSRSRDRAHRTFAAPGLEQGLLGGDDDDAARFDDEVDAPAEHVSLGIGSSGASPLRIQGVPPVAKPGTYVWAKARPIFAAPMGDGGL